MPGAVRPRSFRVQSANPAFQPDQIEEFGRILGVHGHGAPGHLARKCAHEYDGDFLWTAGGGGFRRPISHPGPAVTIHSMSASLAAHIACTVRLNGGAEPPPPRSDVNPASSVLARDMKPHRRTGMLAARLVDAGPLGSPAALVPRRSDRVRGRAASMRTRGWSRGRGARRSIEGRLRFLRRTISIPTAIACVSHETIAYAPWWRRSAGRCFVAASPCEGGLPPVGTLSLVLPVGKASRAR